MRAGDIPVAARRLIFSLGLRLGDRIMLQRFRNYEILLLYLSGTLTRLADSGTGAEDIGKAHCLGHFSERRVPPTTRRQRLGGLLQEVQGKDA